MALSRRLRFKIFNRDKFTCQYCGRKAPEVVLHVDHRYPRALGGGDDEANLITACLECNSGKYTTTVPLEYILQEGPMDMEVVYRLDKFPVEWVWRDNEGVLFRLPDALLETEETSFGVHCVYGPGYLNRPGDHKASGLAERLKTLNDGRIAEIVGAYVGHGYFPELELPARMYWYNVSQLLLMFAIVSPPDFEPRSPIRG